MNEVQHGIAYFLLFISGAFAADENVGSSFTAVACLAVAATILHYF